MNILFLGDVMGRSGRQIIKENLAEIKKEFAIDFCIINGENSAHGFGISSSVAKQLFDSGADVITLGNHAYDNKEIISHLNREPRILRGLNDLRENTGYGYGIYKLNNNKKVCVILLIGNLFMNVKTSNMFTTIDDCIRQNDIQLGKTVDAIIVDMHCEATSEKIALGHYLDGRISALIGTHTHVPTADAMILSNGTAYQSDAGMCGDYNSVIGMKKEISIERFYFSERKQKRRLTPATESGTLCGVIIKTDDATGKAMDIKPIIKGSWLTNTQ